MYNCEYIAGCAYDYGKAKELQKYFENYLQTRKSRAGNFRMIYIFRTFSLGFLLNFDVHKIKEHEL